MSSQLKTLVLLSLLTGLIMLLGGAAGGQQGLMVAFGFAMVMNLGSYWFSDKIVLTMYRAREMAPEDAPALHRMVEELAQNAGVPKPRVYMVPDSSPNAFATGRNPQHAVVAVTEGILKLLSPAELRGVLAHEMAHIAHRDILIQSVTATLASVIVFLANMAKFGAIFSRRDREGGASNAIDTFILAILAPIAATLIQMAISRSREFLADAGGAKFSHTPADLAAALGKLQSYGKQIPMQTQNTATAHMFIVSPLSGSGLQSLFSTHPPIEERIRRLMAMRG